MLPADFTGPPAAAVSGTVVPGAGGITQDAQRPRMSLEWLDDINLSLLGQSLIYQRSTRLQIDWDIGLALPKETAKFDAWVGGRAVRIGVAKIVYYDDRNGDDRLDWSCRGSGCDRVLSVSSQFVLYVEKPPYCQAFEGAPAKPRLTTGYHYYSYEAGTLRKLAASDPLSFAIIDRAPMESDPTQELQAFAAYLVNIWRLSPIGGC